MNELMERILSSGGIMARKDAENSWEKRSVWVLKPHCHPFIRSKELSKIVTFTFITKSNTPDNSLLYMYSLDRGYLYSLARTISMFCVRRLMIE